MQSLSTKRWRKNQMGLYRRFYLHSRRPMQKTIYHWFQSQRHLMNSGRLLGYPLNAGMGEMIIYATLFITIWTKSSSAERMEAPFIHCIISTISIMKQKHILVTLQSYNFNPRFCKLNVKCNAIFHIFRYDTLGKLLMCII
jgi:hypothetical protein